MAERRSIGIIGAGAAGICGAKHMLEAGCDVTVYEIGSHVGGMWVYQNDNGRSSAYKTLHINTAKGLTNFSDFRFDSSVPPFPSHRDMARYLKDYAAHFGVTPHVRFNTAVANVRPAATSTPAGPRWRLETKRGEVFEHDTIIAASGHLTKPLEVAAFRDGFKGEYLHSHDYKEPSRFVGKRVCVVGVGNSALDIASDLAVTSERTILVARSNALIIPKLVFGKPFWDTIQPFYKPWVPAWLRTRALKALVYIIQGNMADLGFPSTAKKVHATSNANIVNHIKYKRVEVKQGIERIDGQRITFTDGRSEDFDTLIAATGYLIDLDWLDGSVLAVRDNALDLYMRIATRLARPVFPCLLQFGHGAELDLRRPDSLDPGVRDGSRTPAAASGYTGRNRSSEGMDQTGLQGYAPARHRGRAPALLRGFAARDARGSKTRRPTRSRGRHWRGQCSA